MQKAKVYRNGEHIAMIEKNENSIYSFIYCSSYLKSSNPLSISVNFPLQKEPFISSVLFAFFFNLLAEGTTKEIQCRELKIDSNDHFTRLLKTTQNNTIGSITIEEISDEVS